MVIKTMLAGFLAISLILNFRTTTQHSISCDINKENKLQDERVFLSESVEHVTYQNADNGFLCIALRKSPCLDYDLLTSQYPYKKRRLHKASTVNLIYWRSGRDLNPGGAYTP